MRHTIRHFITIVIILILAFPQIVLSESTRNEIFPNFGQNESRILKQPNGPFAVMIFEEYALGLNIGVIFYDQMGIPNDGNWWLSERFWADRLWSADVTKILWGLNGKYLYVSTSSIYGDGGVFRLDLKNKLAEKMFPKDGTNDSNISKTEIAGFNELKKKVSIRVIYRNNKIKELVELQME